MDKYIELKERWYDEQDIKSDLKELKWGLYFLVAYLVLTIMPWGSADQSQTLYSIFVIICLMALLVMPMRKLSKKFKTRMNQIEGELDQIALEVTSSRTEIKT